MQYGLQWSMQLSAEASSFSARFCVADSNNPNPVFIIIIRVKTVS
jgi:hypothetical protein